MYESCSVCGGMPIIVDHEIICSKCGIVIDNILDMEPSLNVSFETSKSIFNKPLSGENVRLKKKIGRAHV